MPDVPVKLAACLIVKGTDDEALHLNICLDNIQAYVDDIFLNVNVRPGEKISPKIMKIAKAYTANIIKTEWHDDFAEARNNNFDQVPEDYTHILWLDTDDTIDHPEKVRRVAKISDKYDSVYVDYLYERDEEFNPVTVHMVARLIKNNGSHVWKGRIHETLIETRACAQGATKDFMVLHHSDSERRNKSLERNIKLLQAQLESEADAPDPRTFYYLGSTYIDTGDYENAKALLHDYLQLSGWDQERSAALTKLGRIYLEEANRPEAKKHFMLAIGEAPEDPEPRIEMGSLELELKQLHKARRWLEDVEKMEKNPTVLERNPMSYTFRTYLLLADIYLGLGGSYLDKALEYAKKALKYKRKDKNVREYVKVIDSVVSDKHLLEKVVAIVQELKKNKEEDKIQGLVSNLPKQLDDNPIVIQLRDKEPYKWPEKSIAIFCGNGTLEGWGPWSLAEGIGGSEEAVIRLSKHLNDFGYKIVVYGNPSARSGEYDGVMWRNSWEANPDDEYDIVIGWRYAGLFDKKFKARKKYLWLHDVVDGGEFTPERLNNIDKVIVLSKYHRSLFPMIPDEKIFMSANGIDPEQFDVVERKDCMVCNGDGFISYSDRSSNLVDEPCNNCVQRDPHKVFYGSALERGLVYLCEIWDDIHAAVPGATLNVYYGRESFDAVNSGNPERLKWMDDLLIKVKSLEGITYQGKVSQKEIVKAAFQSGVWAYPTPFPEISCITALKCQAAGAIPVTSDFAALAETVQFGTKIHIEDNAGVGKVTHAFLDEYKTTLIDVLLNQKKQETTRRKMCKWARKHSWQQISKEWDHEFQS